MSTMAHKKTIPKTIRNSRASFDYDIKDEYVAGIVLTGAETKSLRMGRGSLRGAYVTFKDGAPWLLNAHISALQTNAVHLDESVQTRTRKLLLKGREVDELLQAHDMGSSIIPIKLLTQGRYIKIVVGVGKGKKHYDKRQTLKKRDNDLEARRAMQS
jgi:SsrA-binding protein